MKLVLPAPTQILARRIARLSDAGRPLFLQGRLMGGGAIGQAVRRHLARGLPVSATPQAALTLSDRLEQVASWGVALTETPPPEAAPLTLGDVDPEGLGRLLAAFEVPFPRHFAVAVQDHGFYPQGSNRRFRFRYWEEMLSRGAVLRRPGQPPASRLLHPDAGRGRNPARGAAHGHLHCRTTGSAAGPPGPATPGLRPDGGQPGQCPHLCRPGPGRPPLGHL